MVPDSRKLRLKVVDSERLSQGLALWTVIYGHPGIFRAICPQPPVWMSHICLHLQVRALRHQRQMSRNVRRKRRREWVNSTALVQFHFTALRRYFANTENGVEKSSSTPFSIDTIFSVPGSHNAPFQTTDRRNAAAVHHQTAILSRSFSMYHPAAQKSARRMFSFGACIF